MSKEVKFNQDAREGLRIGAQRLTDTVKVTLGAKGRNVAIDRGMGSSEIINDGVTVAKACTWKDPLENMGAYTLKEAASKAEGIAGDGTTTCIVAAMAMLESGLKHINSGANPMDLKRGMEKAVDAVVRKLNEDAIQVADDKEALRSVATISANNDSVMGELIMEAVDKVGPNGMITVEESPDTSTTVTVVEGAEFERGYMSPYFITDMSREIGELENAWVLITDEKISSMKQLVPILELINKQKENRPVLLMANDVESIVLSTIVLNKTQGLINLSCVKNPGYGDKRSELTEDIAVITGATVISEGKGMKIEEATIDDLGYATKVVISKDTTKIIDGNGDEDRINKRIDLIRGLIPQASEEYEKTKLEERLAKLVGGVAVLYIGGFSDSEREEKLYRVDDALSATKAAVEEGIVPGGGIELLNCIQRLEGLKGLNEDENLGIRIVKDACKAPFFQIITNAGLSPEVVLNEVMKKEANMGYNVKTDEYVDMIESGVIDPVKVTKSALTSAASVIGLLLTTEAAIIDVNDN